MCEFSDKLVAWLDRELPDDEAAGVEQHLQACAECGERVSSYEEVSSAFAAYCDRVSTPKSSRKWPVWMPAGIGAGVAAAIALAFLLQPRPVQQLPLHPPKAAPPPAVAWQSTPAVPPIAHRRPAAPRPAAQAQWRPMQPAVEIAIPADAVFPPGAVPAGFSYVTEVSFAADGSPQTLRLWP